MLANRAPPAIGRRTAVSIVKHKRPQNRDALVSGGLIAAARSAGARWRLRVPAIPR